MKLRYQMRGLGIGIIVTALLMGVSKGDKLPLSDAEIKARALELGMVESDSRKLTDIPNTVPISGGLNEPGKSGESGQGEVPETAGEAPESGAEGIVPGEVPETAGEAPESETGGESEPEEAAGTVEAEQSEPDAISPAEPDDSIITFVIESGMSSDAICGKLAELGLVADADAFDDYVCSMGYSQKIHAGTYEIAAGTDEEEILKIITNTR